MNDLLFIIVLPAVAGIIPLLIPRKGKMVAGIVALAVSIWMFITAMRLFSVGGMQFDAPLFSIGGLLSLDFSLRLYHFSSFVLLFVQLFGMLIILYSLGYLAKKDVSSSYYTFMLWTLSVAAGAVLANNLLLLLIFW